MNSIDLSKSHIEIARLLKQLAYKLRTTQTKGGKECYSTCGEYLALLGSLNFCSSTAPYLGLILQPLYAPVPVVSHKNQWKEMKDQQISLTQNALARVISATSQVFENRKVDLNTSYHNWFDVYSDASEEALGWYAMGHMAREAVPNWLKGKPIFYLELWAAIIAISQAPKGSVVVLHTDNMAVYHVIRKMRGSRKAYWYVKILLNVIRSNFLFVIPLWVSTDDNPAHLPSRLNFAFDGIAMLWARISSEPYSILQENSCVELAEALKVRRFSKNIL